MADKATFISELATLVKKHLSPTKLNFKDIMLPDGSTLRYEGDMPMVQMPVTIVQPDGTELPAPDAIYEMEDGTSIEVIDGIIVTVTPPVAEAEVESKDKEKGMPTTPHEMENNTATVKTLIETHTKEHHFTKEEVTSLLEQSVVGMTEKFATATKELSDKIEVMEGYNSDLSALVLKFSEQPAENSVKKLPVNLKSEPTNKRESLEEYRKRMNTQI
jgi:hypothetical protein